VLLIAHLRGRLSGLRRDVMLLGAVGLVASTIVWLWFNLGLALHPNTLDPNVARTVADVDAYFGPVLTVSIVLLIAPIGLSAWQAEGAFPPWLAVAHRRVRAGGVDRDGHGGRGARVPCASGPPAQ
jgi:hypothetical protein